MSDPAPVRDAACPRCGRAFPEDLLQRMGGRCPDCLLSFASETDAPEFPALEILSVLGEGGMGVVYRARQTRLGRIVAVKVLSTRFLADPQFIQRFEREAEAMARLQHPHIVAIHDFGVHGGVPFLVLEHVEGKSLRTQLARGPLPPDRALEIASSLCEALAYAHSRSVIHRDLKPENILIDASGCAKLADFGLARLLTEKASRITSPDARVGTPHYMAPEQVEGGKPGDARADLYALGVVLYEMLTGQLPIGRFAPPSAAGLDPRLDRVVLRLLEKSPDARYESAARVKDDIERIRRSKPAIGRKALWGIGAGVVAAAALVLALGSREDPPVDPPPAPVPWTDLGGSATDGGLSRTPGPSFRPSVAVDRGGRPVVAWRDDTSGNAEIYLRRWDGAAWVEVGGSATAGGISGDSALSAEPALALDGQDRPVVAWFEESSGQYAIRLRRWTGTRWEDLGEGLSAGSVRSVNPTLALDAVGNPVVCWHGFPPGAGAAARREVYLRRWSGAAWTDLGGSGSGGGVSRTAGESWLPTVALDAEGRPVVAWHDNTGGNYEIYLRRWDGKDWAELGGSVTAGGISRTPGRSATGYLTSLRLDSRGHPVVAWEDDGEGSREIYLRRWTGQSWEELGRSATGGGISGTPGASVRPSLALDSEGRPAVAWQEETAPGNTEVYFRRWDGKSWVAAAESASRGGISGTPGLSVDPMMALDREGRIVVAWNEWSMGTPEIYLRRWVPPVR